MMESPILANVHPALMMCCNVACAQVEQSTRSTNRSFKRLIKVNKVSPEDIYKAMCEQTVELVFTAHPTQACPISTSHSTYCMHAAA